MAKKAAYTLFVQHDIIMLNKLKGVEKLPGTGDYENAVSRAYYAVFHTTQARLLTEGQKAE